MNDAAQPPEPRLNLPELTVSELSGSLKRTLEDRFGYVRVRGELGNVKYHSSGHIYLDLKDDKACLTGVVWRTSATRIKVKLEAGLEVVVTGRITTYPGQSKYQIVIETLEPAGLGALMALVEERKRRLGAEGLFDPARKQLLPFLPGIIGIVTSPTGAVIRDILHRLADRFPRRVLLWPVRVQGEGSAVEVTAAIVGFNALSAGGRIPRPDLIIVARGGGSLEDLWCFNEEIVVRAAAESLIPLISAVGHETDITLIDFAADKRAPTPTAAAEMAVPVRSDLLAQVNGLARRQAACWLRGIETRRTELRAAARALPSAEALLAVQRQRLDGAADRLPRALRANAQLHHTRFSRSAARLSPAPLRAQTQRCGERVGALTGRARRAFVVLSARRRDRLDAATGRLATGLRAYRTAQAAKLAREREVAGALMARGRRALMAALHRSDLSVARAGQLLTALSYQSVLTRGFALVRDTAGHPLRSASGVTPGLRLDIEFSDGRVGATAEGTPESRPKPSPATSPAPRRRRGGPDPNQGNLFG
jgi:exodeoxyribonuclease VII large subunit